MKEQPRDNPFSPEVSRGLEIVSKMAELVKSTMVEKSTFFAQNQESLIIPQSIHPVSLKELIELANKNPLNAIDSQVLISSGVSEDQIEEYRRRTIGSMHWDPSGKKTYTFLNNSLKCFPQKTPKLNPKEPRL